jgi:hypothetical protein
LKEVPAIADAGAVTVKPAGVALAAIVTTTTALSALTAVHDD